MLRSLWFSMHRCTTITRFVNLSNALHPSGVRASTQKFYAIGWLLIIGCMAGCSDTVEEAAHSEGFQTMRVTRVVDGDSIEATNAQNQKIEIRLFGIDAPERNQPFAKQAKSHAQRLLKNKSIKVLGHEYDRYERLVGTVYLEGIELSANEQLIDQGSVWVYRQYAKDRAWLQLEDQARAEQRGLWALPAAQRIPPWQWRKDHKR